MIHPESLNGSIPFRVLLFYCYKHVMVVTISSWRFGALEGDFSLMHAANL